MSTRLFVLLLTITLVASAPVFGLVQPTEQAGDSGAEPSAFTETTVTDRQPLRPSNTTEQREPSDPPEPPNRSSRGTESKVQIQTDSLNSYTIVSTKNGSLQENELRKYGEIGTTTETRAEVTMPPRNVSKVEALEWVQAIRIQRTATSPDTDTFDIGSIKVDQFHEQGIRGDGVKVGVIDSSGFETQGVAYKDQIADTRNYKQTPLTANADHGTASTEQVAEMAPDARLYLTAIQTEVDFGAAVNYLVQQDVDVILTELAYYAAPGDGTSYLAQQTDRASEAGITVVSPAGNGRLSHYESEFSDSDGDKLHNFDGMDETNRLGGKGMEVKGSGKQLDFILTWSDFDSAIVSDYDLYLYNERTQTYVAGSQRSQIAGAAPWEQVSYSTDNYKPISLIVHHVSGDQTDTIELHGPNWQFKNEYHTPSGSIVPPATSSTAIAVGSYNSQKEELAAYSAQGPVGGANGITVVGRSHLPVSVYDDVFTGTSGAGPYVAGTVALMQASTTATLSPLEVRNTLRETADQQPHSATRVGGGLINASAAVTAVSDNDDDTDGSDDGDGAQSDLDTSNVDVGEVSAPSEVTIDEEINVTSSVSIPTLPADWSAQLKFVAYNDKSQIGSQEVTIEDGEVADVSVQHTFEQTGSADMYFKISGTVTRKGIIEKSATINRTTSSVTVDVTPASVETEGAVFTAPGSIQGQVNELRSRTPQQTGPHAFVLASTDQLSIVFADEEPQEGYASITGISPDVSTVETDGVEFDAIIATDITSEQPYDLSVTEAYENPNEHHGKYVEIDAFHRGVSFDHESGNRSTTAGILVESPLAAEGLFGSVGDQSQTLTDGVESNNRSKLSSNVKTILGEHSQPRVTTLSTDTEYWDNTETEADGIIIAPDTPTEKFVKTFQGSDALGINSTTPTLYVIDKDREATRINSVSEIAEDPSIHDGETITFRSNLYMKTVSSARVIESATNTPPGTIPIDVILHGGTAWDQLPERRDDMIGVIGASSISQNRTYDNHHGSYQITGEVVSTERIEGDLPGGYVLIAYELDKKGPVDTISVSDLAQKQSSDISNILEQQADPENVLVSVDSTNSPVTEGETLNVDTTVEYIGGSAAPQTVSLSINGTQRDSTTVRLDPGETIKTTLRWNTKTSDAGDRVITVASQGDSTSVPVTVLPDGELSAVFEANQTTVPIGDPIRFNASASSNPNGQVMDYQWDFDSDGVTEATGQTVTHAFDSTGNYTVELTVTDDSTATDTASRTITATSQSNELGAGKYASEGGIVRTDGLIEAINDWRSGQANTNMLLNIIEAWRSGHSF
jgi:PKD repeat protein